MMNINYDIIARRVARPQVPPSHTDEQLLMATLHLMAAVVRVGDNSFWFVGDLTDALYETLRYNNTKRSLSTKVGKLLACNVDKHYDIHAVSWRLEMSIVNRRRMYRLAVAS